MGRPVKMQIRLNTRLTTRKVPRDSMTVMTTICLPVFFIWLQMSSVPIIRPTVHSSKLSVTSYQPDSIRCALRSPAAWGPKIIPAISQPRMAGSFSFEISLPANKAAAMVIMSLAISIIMWFTSFAAKCRRYRLEVL